MVIFNAEMFGLATLHQLRGRVGRNDFISYCLLVSNYEKERLNVLTSSTDGFYIAEKDFELNLKVSEDKYQVVQTLKAAIKTADLVYLMSDPDREGEVISIFINPLNPNEYYDFVANSGRTRGFIFGFFFVALGILMLFMPMLAY